MYVGKLAYEPPVRKYFYKALAEQKIPVVDINEVQGTGSKLIQIASFYNLSLRSIKYVLPVMCLVFSPPEVLIKNGRRFSAYSGFLKPILKRKSLSIYRYSKAVQVSFKFYFTNY